MQDFVTNFVRIMPKQGQDKWMIKLNQMSWLFQEAEYQMVKQGYRKAATVQLDQHNLGEWLEKFNKDSLFYTPIRQSGYYQGYAHKHKAVEPNQPFFWYGCLTRTYEDGQKFKNAETTGKSKGKTDHQTIGRLLGFPECCIRYFIKNFPVNYDPVWLGKSGIINGYPEANHLLRYFGIRITSHISCSPTCKATKEWGQIWLKIMKEINKDLTKELYDLLRGPIIWNSYHGVVQIETPYFVGLTHTFPLLEKPRIIKWQGRK